MGYRESSPASAAILNRNGISEAVIYLLRLFRVHSSFANLAKENGKEKSFSEITEVFLSLKPILWLINFQQHRTSWLIR